MEADVADTETADGESLAGGSDSGDVSGSESAMGSSYTGGFGEPSLTLTQPVCQGQMTQAAARSPPAQSWTRAFAEAQYVSAVGLALFC
jgi:hypothetical protein